MQSHVQSETLLLPAEPQTRRLRAGSSSSRDTDQDSSGPRAIISVSLLHEPDPRSKQYRKTALRQDEGVPLEAVSDQTVGEIQQQIKGVLDVWTCRSVQLNYLV